MKGYVCYKCGSQVPGHECTGDVAPPNEAFERLRYTDVTVHAMTIRGRRLENIIVVLVEQRERLAKRIAELESIAPRKITLPDGRVMIWRCPDELVPAVEDSYA